MQSSKETIYFVCMYTYLPNKGDSDSDYIVLYVFIICFSNIDSSSCFCGNLSVQELKSVFKARPQILLLLLLNGKYTVLI